MICSLNDYSQLDQLTIWISIEESITYVKTIHIQGSRF